MSGIFGVISNGEVNKKSLSTLAMHSRQRGKGSSGLIYSTKNSYRIIKTNSDIMKALQNIKFADSNIVMGQSSITNNDEHAIQPIIRDGVFLLHDGIVLNAQEIWKTTNIKQPYYNDSEAIIGIALQHINEGKDLKDLPQKILTSCQGTVSALLAFPNLGKALLISNNGSLYIGKVKNEIYFSSENYSLSTLECLDIMQIMGEGVFVDIPKTVNIETVDDLITRKNHNITRAKNVAAEESLLQYSKPKIKRCTKCILPETMPFISFDSIGVCNYCRNYKPRNTQKPKEELFELVKPYRRNNKPDCIVPFSGGRDSSYALHLIVNELKMKPITYTYDWGMVTDLGYRNISRMCSALGVENITVAADINKKRQNIIKNLNAWIRYPHLGMISILTAGDKHFFKYVDTIKKQTGINLNLWGINPLEITHFKSGFLGIKPDFEEKKVYKSGFQSQMKYQSHRFKAMLHSPGYFNSSLWDTLSGEYYRSFVKKNDYFHVFDYWQWDENIIDKTLLQQYDWETASDTNTTWRIGDGTAAFYNYVYYTVAGFTEHDTFRSNQIREGQLTRDEALKLVEDENKPRYQNIRWYLDILNMDFTEVINVVNSIPKLYSDKEYYS